MIQDDDEYKYDLNMKITLYQRQILKICKIDGEECFQIEYSKETSTLLKNDLLQFILVLSIVKFIIIDLATTMNFQNSRKAINDYSYNTNQRIGKGYSCQVYRGVNNKTNQLVAIKVVSKHLLAKSQLNDITRAEIHSLQKLKNHNNILELKHAIQTKNSLYIITQLCSKGTLAQNIQRQRKFSQEKAIQILKQIINGYKAIHSQHIIHRDIKPDNIFVNSNNEIKVGDFGFAINSNEAFKAVKENIGSPVYMPYQSLVYNEYSHKSDIWAIGVTFFQMLIGKMPWKSKRQKQLIIQLQSFQVDTLLPSYFTQRASNFLRKVLIRDVSKRMTPQQLFQYTFTQRQQQNMSNNKIAQNKSCKVIRSSAKTSLHSPNETASSNKIGFAELAQSCIYQQQRKMPNIDAQMKYSENSTKQHSIADVANVNHDELQGFLAKKRTSHPQQIITKKAVIKKQSLNDEGITKQNEFHQIGLAQNGKKLKRHTSIESVIQPNTKIQHEEQPVYSIKIEREILFQLQSQINYFRFLFKLFKKMNDNLKSTDQNIKRFKEYLLSMVHTKIQQVKQLQKVKMDTSILAVFKSTQEYNNLQSVLNEYELRYRKQQQKAMCKPRFKSEKEFAQLLANLTTVIYRNIQKQQNNESHKRRLLIVIIQDLVQLSRLYLLQKELSWKQFHKKSEISRILDLEGNLSAEKRWETIQKLINKIIK